MTDRLSPRNNTLLRKKYRNKILLHLGDWGLDWPTYYEMAALCGLTGESMARYFTAEEIAEIEDTGLEMRLKWSAQPRAKAYAALAEKAAGGNISAIKELLDRTEGKVVDRIEAKLGTSDSLVSVAMQVFQQRVIENKKTEDEKTETEDEKTETTEAEVLEDNSSLPPV